MIKTSLLFLLLSFSVICQAQFKRVRLHRPIEATYPTSQIEPSIVIHPNNPKIMAAGTVLSDYYYSKNGGKKWKSKTLKSSYGVWGDPVLVFDTKGRLYYFHLSSYEKSSHLDRIVCQYTDKVNKPFSDGSFPEPNGTKVQDKHWVVADPVSNRLYMTWTQFDAYDSADPADSSIIVFSKSDDQGQTFSKPVRISHFAGDCMDDDNTVEGAVPAVGPNGELYVVWTGPQGLVFQRSLDGGKTWFEKEKHIEKHYEGWALTIPGVYRANGFPILKCDLSNGPNRGTLYLNWCDQRNGLNNTDSWLMVSKDGGDTWSEPRKVNQDSTQSHQFFTWMSIDQHQGYLYFVYYDRRNHTDSKTDVYVSVSRDGGISFTDFKINDKAFTPDASVFFGDYLNIDAVDGHIRPIWPEMHQGKISLWVALLKDEDLR